MTARGRSEASAVALTTGRWTVWGWPDLAAARARVVLVADEGGAVVGDVVVRAATVVHERAPGGADAHRRPRVLADPETLAAALRRPDVVGARELDRLRAQSLEHPGERPADFVYSWGAQRVHPFLFRTPPGTTALRLTLQLDGPRAVGVARPTLRRLLGARDVPLPSFAAPSPWELVRASTGEAPDGTTWVHRAAAAAAVAGEAADEPTTARLGETVPVAGDEEYSLEFVVAQRGVADQGGVVWAVEFLAGETELGTVRSPAYNWDTHTRWYSEIFEALQTDALWWAVEQDESAARRGVARLLYSLEEGVWGMRNVLAHGEPRPNGEDGYGAVHLGRALGGWAIALDLLRGAPALDATTERRVLELLALVRDILMNPRYCPAHVPQHRRSNWNTDRVAGLAMLSLVVPEHSTAQADLRHAAETLNWQLDEVRGADGAWPETLRYHAAVLNRLLPLAVMIRRARAARTLLPDPLSDPLPDPLPDLLPDLLADDRFLSMLRFLARTPSPPDRLTAVRRAERGAEPVVLPPGIGDSCYSDSCYRQLGVAAGMLADTDPGLAAALQAVWRAAGSPVRDDGANPYPVIPLIYARVGGPEGVLDLRDEVFEGIGYVYLRPNPGSAMVLSGADHVLGHDHSDRTSFSLWSDGIPLVLDSGVGKYFNGDRLWFTSAEAHNLVQLADDAGGWRTSAPTCRLLEVDLGRDRRLLRFALADPAARRLERTVLVLGSDHPVYVVLDLVDADRPSCWNLHTLSRYVTRDADGVTAHGYGDRRLDVHLPGVDEVTLAEGALSGPWPQRHQHWLRVVAPPGRPHLAVLHPQAEGAPRAVVTWDERVLRISGATTSHEVALEELRPVSVP